MVPVIGLVQVGEQSIADRYTYIPLIGPVFALVWLVSDLVGQTGFRRYVLPIVGVGLLSICGILTYRQSEYWRNTTTLFQHAIEATPNNASAEFSLGVGLEHDGRLDLAIEHYRAAIALYPQDPQPHYNLGQVLRKQGNWAEAAEQYSAVLQSNPNDYPALVNLAGALARLGQAKEAAARFEDALHLQPDSTEVLNNLAWLLATTSDASIRDGSRAVQLAEHACDLTHYTQTAMVGTLAAAYAAKGRFPDAAATARKACALAEKSKEAGLLEKNQELLNLYESGKPYIETPAR
jgi:Flp pilus assembly protein TadD